MILTKVTTKTIISLVNILKTKINYIQRVYKRIFISDTLLNLQKYNCILLYNCNLV